MAIILSAFFVLLFGFFILENKTQEKPTHESMSASLVDFPENNSEPLQKPRYVENEVLITLKKNTSGSLTSLKNSISSENTSVSEFEIRAKEILSEDAKIVSTHLFKKKTSPDLATPLAQKNTLSIGSGESQDTIPVEEDDFTFFRITSPEKTTEELIEIFSQDPEVESVRPNYYFYPTADYENASSLWGIFDNASGAGINANLAWDKGIEGSGVVVAVIDSGIDSSHPDFGGNIWTNTAETNCSNGVDDDGNGYIDDCHGWDFYDSDNITEPAGDHGTHTSGTVGAKKDSSGVVGVAPSATIMPLKVFGSGDGASNDIILEAIAYATDNGANIISMSLGQCMTNCDSLTQQAISRAHSAGIFIAVASGNSSGCGLSGGQDCPYTNSPANCRYAFGVGATDSSKQRAIFSCHAGDVVDGMAPGQDILSTIPGGYAQLSGTSMATPHVAGMAALIKSAKPSATPDEIENIMCSTADDMGTAGRDEETGNGFINVKNFIELISSTIILVPKDQILLFGLDSPRPIQVSGGEEYTFTFTDGGTGISISGCTNGTSGSQECALGEPTGIGKATLFVTESGGASNTATITVKERPNALRITKTANLSEVMPGDRILYTITYENSERGAYQNVTIEDDYDEELVELLSAPENCSDDSGILTCTIGVLNGNTEGNFSYSMKARFINPNAPPPNPIPPNPVPPNPVPPNPVPPNPVPPNPVPVGITPPIGSSSNGSGGGAANNEEKTVSGISYRLIASGGSGPYPFLMVYSGTEGASQMAENLITIRSSAGMSNFIFAVLDGVQYRGNGAAGAAVLDEVRQKYNIKNDETYLMGESAGTSAALELGLRLRQSYFAAYWANDVNTRNTPLHTAEELGFRPYGNAGPGGDFADADAIVQGMKDANYRTPEPAPYNGSGSDHHGSSDQLIYALSWFAGKTRADGVINGN